MGGCAEKILFEGDHPWDYREDLDLLAVEHVWEQVKGRVLHVMGLHGDAMSS